MQIQKFGLEIRKIGDVNSLYNEVDLVLKKYNINFTPISTDVQVQTTAHALQKMFKTEKYFSVCTVENCAKLCQICISCERMTVYRSIHCMGWNEMLPEYRQMIIAMVLDDFRSVLQAN